jgi:hypothetical protein
LRQAVDNASPKSLNFNAPADLPCNPLYDEDMPLMWHRRIDPPRRASMLCIRWLKYAAQAVLGLTLVFGPAYYLGAQSTPHGQDTLNFLFAAGAQVGKDTAARSVPVDNQTVLGSGDRLKFFLEPQSHAYFYLFHLASNGDLSLLFPADLKEARLPPGQQVYIPGGALWFELDAASGTEKFFLLASKSRLSQLESLYARHVTLTDRAEIQSSTQTIMDEIARLNQKRRSLAAPAERPIRIAGKQRGQQKPGAAGLADITPFAREIVAQGFYGKTFTIDHR